MLIKRHKHTHQVLVVQNKTERKLSKSSRLVDAEENVKTISGVQGMDENKLEADMVEWLHIEMAVC